ncbi:secreted protease [Streptomyces zinciresistens K42]|uniref:Secreted protease n=1 Tax=Streptomyces zinciresistens K42 TaxID=700597 RepID=G2GPA6_9ACTN|nr:alpha/beta hydrolase [Streptomyces zinciresistens]EGX54659.1 secreted protease [Streptomyces zinciresistens K42]
MRAAALYSVAGALLLSALSAAPAGSTEAAPGASERHGVQVAAARAEARGITFGACPKDQGLPDLVKCGTVSVPLDYARPFGKQIRLTVSRVRATHKDPGNSKRRVPGKGALVYNPGGPGASGLHFPLVGVLPKWKRVAAAYDLVGYAPRGVGPSAPLSCQDPRQFTAGPSLAPTHPSASYKQRRVARARAYARGCAARAGAALRHYNSLNNARDLDVLRAALGEDKLTFMGASYGTYFGALYAQLFPSHVRRMVFDSAVNPDPAQIWYRANLAQSAAFEGRWADFRAWVAEHDDVYGLGTTPEQVLRSYEKARTRLAARPAGGRIGPGQLQEVFLQAGYYDDYWPSRAKALSAYLKGDGVPLVELASPVREAAAEEENTNAVYTAVECNDAPWPTDFAVWDRDNTRLARVAPFETWDNVWMNLPCAYWRAPRQTPLDVRTGPGEVPPVLILAAERDAATPYDGALEMQRRLADSVLVTERDSGTHGIAYGPNPCVNGYVDAYLLEGRLPQRRATCGARPEPKPERAGDLKAGKRTPAAAAKPGGRPRDAA